MQGDVEGLVELVVSLEVVPVEEPGDEDEMTRRRDRQQLGEALDEAEDERLPVGQHAGLLAHLGEGQDDGDGKGRAGDDKDADATHGRVIVGTR